MCIAIVKPKGVFLPSKDILQECWNHNYDGAGFAYVENNKVKIKKGFMTFNDFWEELSSFMKRTDPKVHAMLLHFRITTHGGTNPEMTHPFPLSANKEDLKLTEVSTNYAVIHNGVIKMTSGAATKEKDISDTAVFIRDYLSLLAKNRTWFKRPCNIELIETLIDSKMAILNSNNEVIKTSGFIEDNGIFYSNNSYKKRENTHVKDYCNEKPFYRWTSSSMTPLMTGSNLYTVWLDDKSNLEKTNDKNPFNYMISEDGYIYHKIKTKYKTKSLYTSFFYSYEFLGKGSFLTGTGIPYNFYPNSYCYEEQFIGGLSPKKINKKVKI